MIDITLLAHIVTVIAAMASLNAMGILSPPNRVPVAFLLPLNGLPSDALCANAAMAQRLGCRDAAQYTYNSAATPDPIVTSVGSPLAASTLALRAGDFAANYGPLLLMAGNMSAGFANVLYPAVLVNMGSADDNCNNWSNASYSTVLSYQEWTTTVTEPCSALASPYSAFSGSPPGTICTCNGFPLVESIILFPLPAVTLYSGPTGFISLVAATGGPVASISASCDSFVPMYAPYPALLASQRGAVVSPGGVLLAHSMADYLAGRVLLSLTSAGYAHMNITTDIGDFCVTNTTMLAYDTATPTITRPIPCDTTTNIMMACVGHV